MTMPLAAPHPPVLSTWLLRCRAAPWTCAVELVARVGYVARGTVYLSVGLVALLAALGLTPHATGALGAVEGWSEWPAGALLLWLTGLGLYGFAGWRALQALFDVDRQGRTAKGLASRAGQALSGLVYGGLAISVFDVIHTLHHLKRPSEHAAMVAAVERFLSLPGGVALVVAGGLGILACGVGNMIRAVFDHFGRTLHSDPGFVRWAGLTARVGYLSRGLAMALVGFYIARAGLHAHAAEVHGVGGALEVLHRQPMGILWMSLTALGLMAFGAFAFLEAAYRPIRTEARRHGD